MCAVSPDEPRLKLSKDTNEKDIDPTFCKSKEKIAEFLTKVVTVQEFQKVKGMKTVSNLN